MPQLARISALTLSMGVVISSVDAEPRPFPPKTGPDPNVVGPPPRAPSHPKGYATRLHDADPQPVGRPGRVGASTYVYLHTLPPRLADSRERYRARLHLTLDPIFPARLLQDLPNDRLRTELDLLWTPRTDLAPAIPYDSADETSEADPWMQLALGSPAHAEETFIDRAIASPDDPAPKLGYALAQLARGDLAGARFAWRRAVELSEAAPALPDGADEVMADLLATLTRALEDLTSESGGHAEAHFALSVIESLLGNHESALEHASRAHTLRPNDPVLARLVGLLGPQGSLGDD